MSPFLYSYQRRSVERKIFKSARISPRGDLMKISHKYPLLISGFSRPRFHPANLGRSARDDGERKASTIFYPKLYSFSRAHIKKNANFNLNLFKCERFYEAIFPLMLVRAPCRIAYMPAKRTEAEALILILNCTHTHSVPYRHLNIFITTPISAHDNFEESGWKSGGEIFNLQTIGLSVNLL